MAAEKGAVKAILRQDHGCLKQGYRGRFLISLATMMASAYLKCMNRKQRSCFPDTDEDDAP